MVHLLPFFLAALPLASAAYIRPVIPRSLPSILPSNICNLPSTTTPCPAGFHLTSTYFDWYQCKNVNYWTCTYDLFTGANDAVDAFCPAQVSVTTCTSLFDGASHVCESPSLSGDGTTITCANAMRKRNGVSRSPDWIKSRQASVKSKTAAVVAL